MSEPQHRTCTAFEGSRRIASGGLHEVVLQVKARIEQDEQTAALIFDDDNGAVVDVDFRGTPEQVLDRLRPPADTAASDEGEPPRRVGRPKLGVVAREVTLLPRHWDWLNRQPGGASVALRKLVEQARRVNAGKDRIREAQEAAYRFMSAMAGNEAGFEEAARALFRGDRKRFQQLVAGWPVDVCDHSMKLAEPAFPISGDSAGSASQDQSEAGSIHR
jgi:uncharacterized protein